MARLVSYFQMYNNLRRTASNRLISLLNYQQLEELAFKHFSCINKETGQIGYQCPYTGIEFYNYDDIILEHIIPVSSMGGTVLFNCIPAYKEINGSNEKGAKHLLEWWKEKDYYSLDKLDKLLSYIFDAYDVVFANHTIEEIENSYEDIELDENIFKEYHNVEQNGHNPEDVKELSKEDEELKKQAKKTGVISYLGFINDCLRELRENNYDTTKYEEKLKEYEKYGYFENIEQYTLFQNTIKDILENMLGDQKSNLLTYMINFDISKLMNSMEECKNEDDIRNELEKRLNNIERILQENNLSIIEYFKSLKDIQDIDILYKNLDDIIPNEIKIFLENIKIGIDTKINIFINMLNQGNSEILKRRNKESLDGYESIKLADFWHSYQDRIITLLFETLKGDTSYDIARKTILDKYGVHSYEELKKKQNLTTNDMIRIYIDMLNKRNSEILKKGNKQSLDGYESVKLSQFWKVYQDRIITLLFETLKDDSSYDVARQTILDKYEAYSYEELISVRELDLDAKIDIFIKMLNQGNGEILIQGNNLTLDGYKNVKLAKFWSKYQDRIITLLFDTLKDDSSYDIARQTILTYNKVHTYDELINEIQKRREKNNLPLDTKIEIFIAMLNQGNSKILDKNNKEFLEGYPSVKLARFWDSYQDRIKTLLFETLKEEQSYDDARKTVLTYYGMENYEELEFSKKENLHLRIACFIKMLNNGDEEILKRTNKYFDGYPNIKIGHFWYNGNNREIIINILFERFKDDSLYDTARQLILDRFEVKNIDEYYQKIEDESKKMKDNKIIKKQLEKTIRLVDETYKLLDTEKQRRRA